MSAQIENKIVDYLANNKNDPRYVLLDVATYKRFIKESLPKERIGLLCISDKQKKKTKIVAYWMEGRSVAILEVKTNKFLMEVVG